MTISPTAYRCLKKCQRQFYFRYLMASHSAHDPLRHEAFLLKQLTSTEAWAGNLVHKCLETIVVPSLKREEPLNWPAALEETISRMNRQFTFSQARRYRETGMAKSREPDYCALLVHEGDQNGSGDALIKAEQIVRDAFSNLAKMTDLWKRVRGHREYRCEDEFWLKYESETIRVKLDLHCLHRDGHPVIVDWKCYRSMGGSDAAPQLGLYAWALLQQPNRKQIDPATVELLEVMPLSGEVKQHPFDAARLSEVDDQLFEAVIETRRVFGDGKWDQVDVDDLAYANSPGSCFFCPYVGMCKGVHNGTASAKPVRNPEREQLQLFLQAS